MPEEAGGDAGEALEVHPPGGADLSRRGRGQAVLDRPGPGRGEKRLRLLLEGLELALLELLLVPPPGLLVLLAACGQERRRRTRARVAVVGHDTPAVVSTLSSAATQLSTSAGAIRSSPAADGYEGPPLVKLSLPPLQLGLSLLQPPHLLQNHVGVIAAAWGRRGPSISPVRGRRWRGIGGAAAALVHLFAVGRPGVHWRRRRRSAALLVLLFVVRSPEVHRGRRRAVAAVELPFVV